MRDKLKQLGDKERYVFTGVFIRDGIKNGYKGPERTLLLSDIKDNYGNYVSNHLWFNYTKGFEKANLHEGDTVQFTARVSEYEKGYKGKRWDVYKPIEIDYRLSYPTQIKNLGKAD